MVAEENSFGKRRGKFWYKKRKVLVEDVRQN